MRKSYNNQNFSRQWICLCHFVAVGILCCISTPALAKPIYVVKQKDGTIRFTSKAPAQGAQAKVFTASKRGFSYYSGIPRAKSRGVSARQLFLNDFKEPIKAASIKYNIPDYLIRAVIHAESAFNPSAVSPKGARGLMQLIPGTQKRVGVTNAFSPVQNIHGGTRYLSWLLKRFNNNLTLAIAAYNAGEGAVDRHGGIPPYPETRQYVQRVLSLRARYKSALYSS